MQQYQDDKFIHLVSDISKIRTKFKMYISFANEKGAFAVFNEILLNALDECKNPRSPGNKIHLEFDERDGFIVVTDNGRGIPLNILEEVYTSLNMGSNIDSSDKASMKADVTGTNGVGSLATCALAERVEITSFRGPTDGKSKTLIFEEGNKIQEIDNKCSSDKHGMTIKYKPSKVMGNKTRLIWNDIHDELLNLKYLIPKNIKLDSIYIDKKGIPHEEVYKIEPFVNILNKNSKEDLISNKYSVTIDVENVPEEIDGKEIKRYINMEVVFVYTKSLAPYIDAFTNGTNNPDLGDHLDGSIEAICRFLQTSAKNTLSDKDKLDIKWDDVKSGLSMVVNLRTNFERLYTSQTKHKVVSPEFKKIIVNLLLDKLNKQFSSSNSGIKELTTIVKTNARARRESDKVKSAVVKDRLNTWGSYKMKNYDPCAASGIKEYKELFIIEGDSAKGSLKQARDPKFQALFAIRGVSANAFKLTLDQMIGQNGNKEFTDMVKVMNCNVGTKFDINKLNFSKIIIASDADVDGLFIRSLLMAFFFKVFPEIIQDGRLFIAEPPLYRVNDKKDPFVINKEDYINRYVKSASVDYKMGYLIKNKIHYLEKDQLKEFLNDTASYSEEMELLSEHYKINDRLLELIFEEFSQYVNHSPIDVIKSIIENIDALMRKIELEFPELSFDDRRNIIMGSINAKMQLIELNEGLFEKAIPLLKMIDKWGTTNDKIIILQNIKTGTEQELSMLGALKILKKYQLPIIHRFKGLGENDDSDIKTTIMDPNTRTLIRVNIGDIQNDMKVFQVLRGNSPQDALARKQLMREFKIEKSDIDT